MNVEWIPARGFSASNFWRMRLCLLVTRGVVVLPAFGVLGFGGPRFVGGVAGFGASDLTAFWQKDLASEVGRATGSASGGVAANISSTRTMGDRGFMLVARLTRGSNRWYLQRRSVAGYACGWPLTGQIESDGCSLGAGRLTLFF
ncbi:MAG: hypothetical protein AAF702_15165 [Chloroflexota bacterium]